MWLLDAARGLDDEVPDGETADRELWNVSSLPWSHPDRQRPTTGITLRRETYFLLLVMSPIGLSSPFTIDISDIMQITLRSVLIFRSFVSCHFADLSRCFDGRMMGKTFTGQ